MTTLPDHANVWFLCSSSIPMLFATLFILLLLRPSSMPAYAYANWGNSNSKVTPTFDKRRTLSREDAIQVYDTFAQKGHVGGNDADSGYGGPAIHALLQVAKFKEATYVIDYGCGQGKLAELVLSSIVNNNNLHWHGVDQSPGMAVKFRERCIKKFPNQCSFDLISEGNDNDDSTGTTTTMSTSSFLSILNKKKNRKQMPNDNNNNNATPGEGVVVDRFVPTYCLDLLSEEDIYKVLDIAQNILHPEKGLLLLAGITWGYKYSIKTAIMTLVWEILYLVLPKKVGGCRPQYLEPYLQAKGWKIESCIRTLPNGYPWMVSEVICARPPPSPSQPLAPIEH